MTNELSNSYFLVTFKLFSLVPCFVFEQVAICVLQSFLRIYFHPWANQKPFPRFMLTRRMSIIDRVQPNKICTLGAGECGKSTVLKQMRILHSDGFTNEEKDQQKRVNISIPEYQISLILSSEVVPCSRLCITTPSWLWPPFSKPWESTM